MLVKQVSETVVRADIDKTIFLALKGEGRVWEVARAVPWACEYAYLLAFCLTKDFIRIISMQRLCMPASLKHHIIELAHSFKQQKNYKTAVRFGSIEIRILTSQPAFCLLWIWLCEVSAWLQLITCRAWFYYEVVGAALTVSGIGSRLLVSSGKRCAPWHTSGPHR